MFEYALEAPVSALLTVRHQYASTVKRMPAVRNFNFVPDMGRMTTETVFDLAASLTWSIKHDIEI